MESYANLGYLFTRLPQTRGEDELRRRPQHLTLAEVVALP